MSAVKIRLLGMLASLYCHEPNASYTDAKEHFVPICEMPEALKKKRKEKTAIFDVLGMRMCWSGCVMGTGTAENVQSQFSVGYKSCWN